MMTVRIVVVRNIGLRKRSNRNLQCIRWIITVNSADLLNLKVKHKGLGIGVITEVSDNSLTVKFETKESKFVYPDAFEKFLVVENLSVQAEIVEEIKSKKLADEVKRQVAEKDRQTEKELQSAKRQASPKTRNRRNIEDGFGPDYNVRHLAKKAYSYLSTGRRAVWN